MDGALPKNEMTKKQIDQKSSHQDLSIEWGVNNF